MWLSALFLIASIAAAAMAQAPRQICAIDMGSNTFRRIVGSFESGRYEQKSIEPKTLGVGDDVARHGGISDAKLAEIEETMIGFARSCQNEGVTRIVAIGTAAFRDAPNGATVITLAAKHGISMEIATELRESELRTWLVRSVARDTPSSIMAAGVSSSFPPRGARRATSSSAWATGPRTRRSSQRLRIRTLQYRRFATA
jgi:exopolyphosphatase/pppGpp-phosphohydrolase